MKATTRARFEQLYQREYARLYTLAVRMTGSRSAAEDVLQAAFLSAYQAFPQFRHQSTAGTWLYRIVLNAAKKYVKKARRLPIVEYAESHHLSEAEVYESMRGFGMTDDETLTNQVREACLQMFMNCLPPKYRAVYTLRGILDLSVAETADVLGIRENTVKVNFHRARSRIQSHFAGRCALIRPGTPCDCRVYAQCLQETNQTGLLIDLKAVRKKEQAAAREFRQELSEVLAIQSLYDTELVPMEYPRFLERIKALARSQKFKLLNY